MPLPDLEAEMHTALRELDAMDPREGIVIAQAVMGAATAYLTRLGGHDVVAAMLRRDADAVASFKPAPGEPRAPSAALQ